MSKLEDYHDLEHAVGHIYCLEEHFKRISKRLDEAGIPREEDGVPLIVEQRVAIAICMAKNEPIVVPPEPEPPQPETILYEIGAIEVPF